VPIFAAPRASTTERAFCAVVRLWIKDDVEGFEAFERAAAAIMADYGGRIETVVRCGPGDGPFETHVVAFPSRDAFEKYREDPRLHALGPERERVIARTEIVLGTLEESYAPSPSHRDGP
jgi:uncharacterized protein (DUF1330 family)